MLAPLFYLVLQQLFCFLFTLGGDAAPPADWGRWMFNGYLTLPVFSLLNFSVKGPSQVWRSSVFWSCLAIDCLASPHACNRFWPLWSPIHFFLLTCLRVGLLMLLYSLYFLIFWTQVLGQNLASWLVIVLELELAPLSLSWVFLRLRPSNGLAGLPHILLGKLMCAPLCLYQRSAGLQSLCLSRLCTSQVETCSTFLVLGHCIYLICLFQIN